MRSVFRHPLSSRLLRRHLTAPRLAFLTVAFGAAAVVGILSQDGPASRPATTADHAEAARPVAPPRYTALLAPAPVTGRTPGSFATSAPVAAWQPKARAEAEPDAAPFPLPETGPERLAVAALPPHGPVSEEPMLREARNLRETPLPLPRPAGLSLPKEPERPETAAAPKPQRRAQHNAALPAAQEDNRSFFEKLFGVQKSAGPALAYAAPEDDIVDRSRGRRLSPVVPSGPVSASAGTAVYDISAKTVYMPNGEQLEAHSGLGDKMDDPRFAHVRMHGVTPPHVYNLTEREAPFHGVRALRLHPVGGSGAIHGRAGLLAHTYLLGPRGDLEWLRVLQDYDRFLQAYLRGEVKRLVVVVSRG